MAKIQIVDDRADSRCFLMKLLGYGWHQLVEAADGVEGLQLAKAERPDLIISDMVMPRMDGFEFVRQIRNDPDIAGTVVIFYTATYGHDDALALAQSCGVVYLLQKPSRPEVILKTVAEALGGPRDARGPARPSVFQRQHVALLTDTVSRKVIELEAANLQLQEAYEATLEGWVRALDLRDKETEGHTQRVTQAAIRLARAVGMEERDLVEVRRGALLHDIGKIGVPDRILLKPGPLTEEEWQIMRLHPSYAYEMLSPISYLRHALDIPYCHHEKWDGTGYPRGLRAEQIPLAARLFAVVDVWDALAHDRPYRAGWPEERVREYILERAGTHFDAQAVRAFVDLGAIGWEE
jgi:putative two-component system response regulator